MDDFWPVRARAHRPFLFLPIHQSVVCIPNSWKWCILSIFVYLIERIWREVRSRYDALRAPEPGVGRRCSHIQRERTVGCPACSRQTFVTKVIQHPSKVVEVQMKKPSMRYKPGQYLFLNCPEISRLEWHPFTISSAPEEDFTSVHIRVVGDWTSTYPPRLGLMRWHGRSSPCPVSSLFSGHAPCC